jgi:hypothetical protein
MARNTEKREKREMHIVGLEYGEKIKKRGKWKMHNIRPGLWRENWKNVENETLTW